MSKSPKSDFREFIIRAHAEMDPAGRRSCLGRILSHLALVAEGRSPELPFIKKESGGRSVFLNEGFLIAFSRVWGDEDQGDIGQDKAADKR